MKEFLGSNAARDRLIRTIIQGIIGVLIANVDLLVEPLTIPVAYKPMIVMLVMAILSPIMAYFGDEEQPAEEVIADDNEE